MSKRQQNILDVVQLFHFSAAGLELPRAGCTAQLGGPELYERSFVGPGLAPALERQRAPPRGRQAQIEAGRVDPFFRHQKELPFFDIQFATPELMSETIVGQRE